MALFRYSTVILSFLDLFIRNKLEVTGAILKPWPLHQHKAKFWSRQGCFGIFFPTLSFQIELLIPPSPLVLFVVVLMFFFLSAKGAAQWFSRSAKVHWLSHDDWCLREGHDSWIQDRPDPGCHFKQSDRGEKPCLMASLPQKSDASHLGRPQRKP